MSVAASNPMAPTRIRRRNNVSTKNQKWTPEEDSLLHQLVQESETVNWKAAEGKFPGKTSQQIFERWTKVLDPALMKGSWTRQEDEIIISYVKTYGCKSWTKLASLLPGRIGKQCRERWLNHLNPDLNRGPWSPEEDQLLMSLHEQFGNHWSKIASLMPSRADNMIKNRWYSTLSKRSPSDYALIPIIQPQQQDQQISDNSIIDPQAQSDNKDSILPRPVIEEITSEGATGWNPSLTMTPMFPSLLPGISITPSFGTPSNGSNTSSGLGLISPMMPSDSPFALLSPYAKMTPLFSPWAETPKNSFVSPMRQKCSPPSLSENRAELMNLIIHQ